MNINGKNSGLLLTVLLAGCALSPQTVSIAPDIKVPTGNYQQQQKSIAIQVNDSRANRVIGTRGGIYKDTSEITAAADITQAIQNSLAGAFRVLGYNVISGNADAGVTVEITDLKYTTSGDPAVRSVQTSAALKATCRNGSYTVTNEYRVTDNKDVLKAPSGGENQELINGTLSSTLQRLVNDAALLDCVNR